MKTLYKILHTILIFIFLSCSGGDDTTSGDSGNNDSNESNNPVTLWKGSNTTFTKNDGADPSKAENQDRLTDNVWITRGNGGGQIYNAAKENTSSKTTSPTGTKWAVGSIDQVSSLSFRDFRTAVSKPKNVIGKNLVMHLVSDNIYVSVKFTSWSSGKAGGFAYERSTE
ncbi:MAG: hypothetical protein CMC84_01420 [Flavobacteriaceae bacterium]|nr:hypothetical protein [Flavobacteriaceae bacterium]